VVAALIEKNSTRYYGKNGRRAQSMAQVETSAKKHYRARGTGTATKRPDGRWTGQADLGRDQAGKRVRRTVYGKTRAAVEEQLRALLTAKDRGTASTSRRQTVGEYLTYWFNESATQRVRYSTGKRYRQIIDQHLAPTLGGIYLDKLGPEQVQALLNALERKGQSPRSIQQIRAVLRAALTRAMKWGLVARNAAALADGPRIPHKAGAFLDASQARQFLEAAQGDRLEALYSVALSLGLRQGEALGLRWQDIDLDRGHLTVANALQRVNGRLGLVEVKTNRSRRTVTLPGSVLAGLKEHRERQLFERRAAGKAWQEGGYVFTTTIGTPLDDGNLRRAFWALLRKADLPKIRFYDLRHSCASLLLAQGVHPRTVMEILGHSNIAVTMNTYSHVFASVHDEAAAAMDRALTGS
jgi:integrase